MCEVRIHRHPAGGEPPERLQVANVGEWLLERYGRQREHFRIFEGEPSRATDVTGDAARLARSQAAYYTVLEQPGGLELLTTALINLAISTVIAVVARELFAPDPKPLANRTQQSPNNALTDRQNQVRLLQRVEDIFGTVRSVPSLLMPTYTKYVANQKVEIGLYCIGRGHYEVGEVREGDSPLENILGASAAVYGPFSSPNAGTPQLTIGDPIIDRLLSVARASGVDGIVLKALNQIQPAAGARYTFIQEFGFDTVKQKSSVFGGKTYRPNFLAIATVGQTLTISNAKTADGVTPLPAFNGTRTIVEVADGFVRLQGTPLFATAGQDVVADIVVNNGFTEWTDWKTLPQAERTEVWTNVLALRGMYKDDGAQSAATVAYEVQIERLDAATMAPTGQVETVTGSISAASTSEQAETLEHVTAWVGPARVRARRTTQYDYDFNGAVVDEITWMDLNSVSPVTKSDFGNKTIIHSVTHATVAATAVRNRQLNCLASRKLPTFDGTAWSGAFDADGRIASGTIAATSRMIDILGAVTVDPLIGARPISDLDVAQVWGVQQQLDTWNTEAGQFNYTFDSDELSYEETVRVIADAAFCKAYRQNGVIRLALTAPQASAVGVFTHRNLNPDLKSFTITRTFASDREYDGVELAYADPESEAQETIRLPLDGTFTKAKKIEVSGIRSYEQAWLRANREYQRLLWQRLTLEAQVTVDARALLPDSRINVVDMTAVRNFDGDVIGQDGQELILDQDVEFTAGEAHSIILKRRDGTPQSIPVVAGSATNRVLLQELLAEPVQTELDPAAGVRTTYSFASDSARGAQAWMVQEIEPTEQGYIKLTCINYADEYFAADDQPIPARATVIND